jgi:putative oxidoreductase
MSIRSVAVRRLGEGHRRPNLEGIPAMSELTLTRPANTTTATSPTHPVLATKSSAATKSIALLKEILGNRATFTDQSAQRGAVVVSLVRVVVGFLWVCHGLQGFGAFGGIDGHGASVPLFVGLGFWASAIETVVGAMVLVGLATRPAAVLCSGVMAFAYFTVHVPLGLFPIENMGEEAAVYCWIFLLIAVVGPGRFAVDALIRRRRAVNR